MQLNFQTNVQYLQRVRKVHNNLIIIILTKFHKHLGVHKHHLDNLDSIFHEISRRLTFGQSFRNQSSQSFLMTRPKGDSRILVDILFAKVSKQILTNV